MNETTHIIINSDIFQNFIEFPEKIVEMETALMNLLGEAFSTYTFETDSDWFSYDELDEFRYFVAVCPNSRLEISFFDGDFFETLIDTATHLMVESWNQIRAEFGGGRFLWNNWVISDDTIVIEVPDYELPNIDMTAVHREIEIIAKATCKLYGFSPEVYVVKGLLTKVHSGYVSRVDEQILAEIGEMDLSRDEYYLEAAK